LRWQARQDSASWSIIRPISSGLEECTTVPFLLRIRTRSMSAWAPTSPMILSTWWGWFCNIAKRVLLMTTSESWAAWLIACCSNCSRLLRTTMTVNSSTAALSARTR
jgi:hypothetical protein